jgi:hypothetical protein
MAQTALDTLKRINASLERMVQLLTEAKHAVANLRGRKEEKQLVPAIGEIN